MNDFVRVLSLKTKLLVTLIIAFVLLTVVIAANLYNSLTSMEQELGEQARKTMEQEVLARLDSDAGKLANRIGGDGVFLIPITVASNLANAVELDDSPLTRDQVNQIAPSTLKVNEGISSMYIQFEPNGFDGLDADYLNTEDTHSVANTGGLEIYWIRDEQNQISQERVEDSTEKYADTVGEFGLREAEWYLCSKDSLKPCASDPYLYEITPEYSEL